MKFLIAFIFLIMCVLNPVVYAVVPAATPVIDITAIVKLGEQIKYLKAQIDTLSKKQYQWSNAQDLINQLGNVMQKMDGLSYNAINIDKKFKKAYPGYVAPDNFSAQYQKNIQLSLNTINAAMQSMGMSAKDFKNENKRLDFLQSQSQKVKGQTQAIQASSQIASESVSQLQLLRQTMMAQSSAQNAYYATQLQKEASENAEIKNIINAGSTKVPKYGSSGRSLSLPKF